MSFSLSVEFKSLGDFRSAYRRNREEAQVQLDNFLDDEIEYIRERVVAATPRSSDPRRSGDPAIADMWRIELLGGRTAALINDSPVAEVLITGSRAHPIVARNAPYLIYQTRFGGYVRTARANHPGTAPNEAMNQALDDSLSKVRRDFSAMGARMGALYFRSSAQEGVSE